MNEHHPIYLGRHDVPEDLADTIVRHKELGWYGYISHIERRRNYPEDDDPHANRARLWIVYPPIPGEKKTWSAGSAFADEIKVKRTNKKKGKK